VVHAFPLGDLGDFRQRAEQRQAAVADVVAAGTIVEEPNDLITQLTMLEDAVRDDAAQIPGAGDEDPLQPDPGAPASLEQLTHRLSGRVGEHQVEDEEEAPHDLGHLIGALCPGGL